MSAPYGGVAPGSTWQDRALARIVRCPVCGSWESITERELIRRAEELAAPPSTCRHLTQGFIRQETTDHDRDTDDDARARQAL